MSSKSVFFGLVVAVAVGAVAYQLLFSASGKRVQPIEVRLPAAFSANAEAGKALFNDNCAACHGANAAGTEAGPPLVHRIYEPNHHADYSFVRAVKIGVRAHHWPFGNMPPVPGVRESDVAVIVSYVRELQRANGIN